MIRDDTRPDRIVADRKRALLFAVVASAAAFALRCINSRDVAPFDELYHWKRISYSVAHFPSVLDFDADRGLSGAFCPWPPLYDLLAAGIALLFGAKTPAEVLSVIVWIPPAVSALLIGVVVFVMARRSPLAGALAGIGLACAPFLVFHSSIGDIDHHFLEPFLVVAIAGATMLERPSFALAAAMVAALMVQTALILACGLAFVCLFIARRNGAAAFAIASLVVAAYRLPRADGYPDGVWFLGWLHAILLAIAALAFILPRRLAAIAMVIGAAVAVPGLQFFRGDPWLASIREFQPVWKTPDLIGNYVAALATGLVFSVSSVISVVKGFPTTENTERNRATLAIFTVAYIIATLPRRRFNIVATALAIVATAFVADKLWHERKRVLAILIAASTAIVPPIHLAMWFALPAPVNDRQEDYARAAEFLRERGMRSRVLAPWSYGHLLDVIGGQNVVIDNFGSMPDAALFDEANGVLTRGDETEMARYCDRNGVRYVIGDQFRGRAFKRFAPVATFGRAVVLERVSDRSARQPTSSP